jgi:hypothetical protein
LTENDLDHFVAKLRTIMESPDLLRRAGENARSTIYVSWDQVMGRVALRYREIIEEFSGSGGRR